MKFKNNSGDHLLLLSSKFLKTLILQDGAQLIPVSQQLLQVLAGAER